MDIITLVGSLAIITGILRLAPQIIKTVKTKKVRDISLVWEIFGALNAALWFTYGYLRSDTILLIGTAIVFAFYLILIYQKFTYSTK